jgi:hypothetical protein
MAALAIALVILWAITAAVIDCRSQPRPSHYIYFGPDGQMKGG